MTTARRCTSRGSGSTARSSAVGKRDRFRFISLVKTFRNHPACKDGSDDWINSVVPSDHDDSFHPNEQGHRAIAGTQPRSGSTDVAPGYFR